MGEGVQSLFLKDEVQAQDKITTGLPKSHRTIDPKHYFFYVLKTQIFENMAKHLTNIG